MRRELYIGLGASCGASLDVDVRMLDRAGPRRCNGMGEGEGRTGSMRTSAFSEEKSDADSSVRRQSLRRISGLDLCATHRVWNVE